MQIRDQLDETGYTLITRISKTQVVLRDGKKGLEIWEQDDKHDGRVIVIQRKGYKYAKRLTPKTDSKAHEEAMRAIRASEGQEMDMCGLASLMADRINKLTIPELVALFNREFRRQSEGERLEECGDRFVLRAA